MKIFFCDVCNESIPLQDIKENKATTIKGKIFCLKCNPLNELDGGATPSKSSSAGSPLLGFVVFLLVIAVGGLGWAVYEMRFGPGNRASDDRDARIAQTEQSARDLRMAVNGLQATVEALQPLRGLPNEVQPLREKLAAQGGDITQIRTDVGAFKDAIAAAGHVAQQVEALSLKQDEVTQKFAAVNSVLDELKAAVQELRDRPPVVLANGAPERPSGSDAGAEPESAPPDSELTKVLENLNSNDPTTRWDALEKIRKRRDKALASHVLPLLDDRDTFVRGQAAYTLGELKAMPAVPRLVKLLRDDEIMVREEALTSLMVITGQTFKFDVNGSKDVRDKGIRKWEDWIASNKDKF